jgi:hypothetical protein
LILLLLLVLLLRWLWCTPGSLRLWRWCGWLGWLWCCWLRGLLLHC